VTDRSTVVGLVTAFLNLEGIPTMKLLFRGLTAAALCLGAVGLVGCEADNESTSTAGKDAAKEKVMTPEEYQNSMKTQDNSKMKPGETGATSIPGKTPAAPM